MTNEVNPTATATETNSMSPWSMLVSIFYEPTRVFQAVKVKPSWLIPFVIVLLVACIGAYYVTPIAIAEQMENVRNNPELTDTQRDQMLQGMNMFGKPIVGLAMALVGVTFMMFLSVGILMLVANVIMGGKARFTQVLSVMVLSSMTWVISYIVKTPLMVAKNSIDIRTSAAVLLPGDAMTSSPALYHFLNSYTDIFVIWELILLVIGVKIIYDFATQKAALAVLIPTAILALITTGLSSLSR